MTEFKYKFVQIRTVTEKVEEELNSGLEKGWILDKMLADFSFIMILWKVPVK